MGMCGAHKFGACKPFVRLQLGRYQADFARKIGRETIAAAPPRRVI
jgi:hypothetical protein